MGAAAVVVVVKLVTIKCAEPYSLSDICLSSFTCNSLALLCVGAHATS
jgi:hypothetical protein